MTYRFLRWLSQVRAPPDLSAGRPSQAERAFYGIGEAVRVRSPPAWDALPWADPGIDASSQLSQLSWRSSSSRRRLGKRAGPPWKARFRGVISSGLPRYGKGR